MATSAIIAILPTAPSPSLPFGKLPNRSNHDIFCNHHSSKFYHANHGARVEFRGGIRWVRRFQSSRASPPGCLITCSSAEGKDEPFLLRVAVSGVTELLRALSGGRNDDSSPSRTGQGSQVRAEIPDALVVSPADLLEALRSDFARSYFLTGEFSDYLYAENCFYKDPTVQFSGRNLYKRNLKLLVPFYEDPSLVLDSIYEGKPVDDESSAVILANWRLRVYLKLPWKPFIAVDGLTTYSWDQSMNRIVSHVESWNITGLQAMGQLFTPSERAFWTRMNRRIAAKQD